MLADIEQFTLSYAYLTANSKCSVFGLYVGFWLLESECCGIKPKVNFQKSFTSVSSAGKKIYCCYAPVVFMFKFGHKASVCSDSIYFFVLQTNKCSKLQEKIID